MKRVGWNVALALCGVSASAVAKPPTITTVHAFNGFSGDGAYPSSALTYHGGALFGTTQQGGTEGVGTIYKIDAKNGSERVVYSFRGNSDGSLPGLATLIFRNNVIYGTTPSGGQFGFGTIFKYDLGSGVETVLHSFAGGHDGATPFSGVYHKDGVLYGATSAGGKGNCSGGCGTVYKFTLSTKTESILHSFRGGMDSQFPMGEFIPSNGELVGVTRGSESNCGKECGTIYYINPKNGDYNVVISFDDSANPMAGLAKVGKYFYGTTFGSGTNNLGTVFQFDPATLSATILASVGVGKLDGSSPRGNLIFQKGSLFATSWLGGANGVGTVFSINPINQKATLLGSLGGALGSFTQSGLTYDGKSFWGTTQNPGTVFKFTLGQ